MPRCQWCNRFSERIHKLDNGRTILLLCDLCFAQKGLLEHGELRPEDLARPSLWARLKRFLRRS